MAASDCGCSSCSQGLKRQHLSRFGRWPFYPVLAYRSPSPGLTGLLVQLHGCIWGRTGRVAYRTAGFLACGAVDHQAIVCGENERTFREFREVWDKALVFSLANVGGAIAQSPGGRLSFWFEMIAALEGEPMKTTKYALAVALVLIALAPSAVRADSIVFDASGTF